MHRLFLIGGAVAALASSPQLPNYRPSSLGDLVDAVGSNRDGLEDLDLSPDVDDYAMFVGETLGIAARLPADPERAIVVLWRHRGELWRYRAVAPDSLAPVRIGEPAASGRIESVRQLGTHAIVTLRSSPHDSSTIVLRRDLAPVAFVRGAARLALPSGSIVVERPSATGDGGLPSLAELYPATREMRVFYTAGRAEAARAAAIVSLQFDERTDTLRFTLDSRSAAKDSGRPVRIECRPMSQPARTCAAVAR